jgi:hypothetical protein
VAQGALTIASNNAPTVSKELTYDDGTLEIAMPLADHEQDSELIGLFIRILLVVEVDITHTDVDQNRLYASMGVPEFWRFNGQVWTILQLQDTKYSEVPHSPTFPGVEKEDLYRFLEQARIDEVDAELSFRQWVRQQLSDR